MSKDGNQFAHAPSGSDQMGGTLSAQIPGCDPEMGGARPRPVWKKAMPFRHFILVGAVAGLLLAGFDYAAQATNFTNGDFVTFTQGDWGDTPTPNNAAGLLENNYDTVYASSVSTFEVGISGPSGFSMLFTDPDDLLTYLPATGMLGPLNSDLIDPSSSASGNFGGDVTALVLNINFSDAGLLTGNLNVHFGDLVLQNFTKMKGDLKSLSALNGLTVRQFAADVNILLGGGSFGIYTADDIPIFDSITANLNAGFEDGFVGPFASNNLAVAQIPPVMQAASHSVNSIALTWSTTPASMYQVQFTTNLTQTNWISLGGPIRATNVTCTASEVMTNSQEFFRVQLLPPQRTIATNFVTYGQADWADNLLAATLVFNSWGTVYFGVFLIGDTDSGGFTIDFEGPDALLVYLPAAGTPGPLNATLDDPTSTPSGTFGGDVAALKLNIDLSDAGFLPTISGVHFGDLVLKGFTPQPRGQPGLNGLTVRQFSAVVNHMLGGARYGHYTIAYFDSIVQDINTSFLAGTPSAFATNNLTVP